MRTHQKPLVLLRPVIDLGFHHRLSQMAELAPLAAQIWPQILAQSLVGSWILPLHCCAKEAVGHTQNLLTTQQTVLSPEHLICGQHA